MRPREQEFFRKGCGGLKGLRSIRAGRSATYGSGGVLGFAVVEVAVQCGVVIAPAILSDRAVLASVSYASCDCLRCEIVTLTNSWSVDQSVRSRSGCRRRGAPLEKAPASR